MSALSAAAAGFRGAVYDGHYVYFVPNSNSLFVRYDTTTANFTSTASWSEVNTSQVVSAGTAFSGAVYDGRSLANSAVQRRRAATPAKRKPSLATLS